MAPMSAWAHCLSIPLRCYLDDWLVSSASQPACLDNVRSLLLLCSQVGDSGQLVQVQSVSQPEEAGFGYDSRHRLSPNLPVTRLGQSFSCSGLTVSVGQGSTFFLLQVFAGTSYMPSMVSARWAPAEVGAALMSKEALVGYC